LAAVPVLDLRGADFVVAVFFPLFAVAMYDIPLK
jgi:hypothetical protein